MRAAAFCIQMLLLSFLAGCAGASATGSTTITGTARSALSKNEVTLYHLDSRSQPSQYETIGTIDVTVISASEQAARDRAALELKKRAAKIGANGVRILHTESKAEDEARYTSRPTGPSYVNPFKGDYRPIRSPDEWERTRFIPAKQEPVRYLPGAGQHASAYRRTVTIFTVTVHAEAVYERE